MTEDAKKLKAELGLPEKSAWERLAPGEVEAVFNFCEGYKSFLTQAKTEREAVRLALSLAREKGFVALNSLSPGQGLAPGTKFFWEWRQKVLVLGVAGEAPLDRGLRLVGAHIDSPRLDLKPLPLYESGGLALLKTHYYGGIKKYQWMALPLALHGVAILRDGTRREIVIGEDPSDPIFSISDLLPHLAKEQMKKNMEEAVTGDDLNLVVGNIPYPGEDIKEKVRLNILKILHERFGLVEEDFIVAELELVPAGPARDLGLDRSMVGGYGQDDRVCAYTALQALLEIEHPQHTAIVLWVDKEEIGSTGNTGAQSRLLEQVVTELAARAGQVDILTVGRIMASSKALSADVTAGLDPTYEGVFDKHNASLLGRGVVLNKYTGYRGKYEANDASAEFMAELRAIFHNAGVIWQSGELGKVDQGGGGTIAKYLAYFGPEVADCGPPLLSMHAPLEIASKVDIFMAYRAYGAFLRS
ncbi:Aspartyl aminopeptidase [Thermanaeromonas toyohensis ToBE]|uniref:M18 family aminopeptidase n=1 Tax=Thermanaeromonas toyohensis ToBE TaxID=698762 RepID=A0A1W1W3H4_9FIRM|nr:aminopeptidase [Thermanaeromonas toyohensis]SMC00043.1 Aspartyl aminopeptidase [Thermanaeromonas toyohensis ToBE]